MHANSTPCRHGYLDEKTNDGAAWGYLSSCCWRNWGKAQQVGSVIFTALKKKLPSHLHSSSQSHVIFPKLNDGISVRGPHLFSTEHWIRANNSYNFKQRLSNNLQVQYTQLLLKKKKSEMIQNTGTTITLSNITVFDFISETHMINNAPPHYLINM